jgi:hypothetical protein
MARLDMGGHSPQPYEQLAACYRQPASPGTHAGYSTLPNASSAAPTDFLAEAGASCRTSRAVTAIGPREQRSGCRPFWSSEASPIRLSPGAPHLSGASAHQSLRTHRGDPLHNSPLAKFLPAFEPSGPGIRGPHGTRRPGG